MTPILPASGYLNNVSSKFAATILNTVAKGEDVAYAVEGNSFPV